MVLRQIHPPLFPAEVAAVMEKASKKTNTKLRDFARAYLSARSGCDVKDTRTKMTLLLKDMLLAFSGFNVSRGRQCIAYTKAEARAMKDASVIAAQVCFDGASCYGIYMESELAHSSTQKKKRLEKRPEGHRERHLLQHNLHVTVGHSV